MNPGTTPLHEHSDQPVEGQQPPPSQQMEPSFPAPIYPAQPVNSANLPQNYPIMPHDPQYQQHAVYDPKYGTQNGSIYMGQAPHQYAVSMQPTGQYPPPPPMQQQQQQQLPQQQYATASNMNTTIPITVDLKSINPAGTCCFCVSIKTGAMIIAVLSAIFGILSILLSFTVLGILINIVVTAVCSFGIYCIFYGRYQYLSFYAVAYAIMHLISICISYALVSAADCSTGNSDCASQKTGAMTIITINALIHVYFVAVTFEYVIKLRKQVALMTGIKLGDLF